MPLDLRRVFDLPADAGVAAAGAAEPSTAAISVSVLDLSTIFVSSEVAATSSSVVEVRS